MIAKPVYEYITCILANINNVLKNHLLIFQGAQLFCHTRRNMLNERVTADRFTNEP